MEVTIGERMMRVRMMERRNVVGEGALGGGGGELRERTVKRTKGKNAGERAARKERLRERTMAKRD